MKKFNNVFAIFAICTIVAIGSTGCGNTKTVAIEQGWDLLGERTVNFVRDRDEIALFNQTLYTAVKFQVLNKDASINDVNVVYPNGDKLSPSLNEIVAAGAFSREIELDPLGREIRGVQFKYRSKGNLLKGRARVLVFGKRFVPRQ